MVKDSGQSKLSQPKPADYTGQAVALLTQHGKEQVISPVLEAAIGCQVVHVSGYDTDQLGTFTREIPRAGTQIEAARKKARIGMQLSGLSLGLASEGAFGPDPIMGMFPWNVEYLVWIDDLNDIEVLGVAQAKANFAHLLAKDWAMVETFARRWGFPGHYLVIRPEHVDDPRIRKGISSWQELEASFAWAKAESANGQVLLETDVRAHANPTRLSNIRSAAEDLAKKLAMKCPSCSMPGFWIIEHVPGLPCTACGSPTREPRADIYGCVKCQHHVTRDRTDRQTADAGRCNRCNP